MVLTGCGRTKDVYVHEEEEEVVTDGDDGEEEDAIEPIASASFESDAYTVDSEDDYYEGDSFISINRVEFLYTKIKLCASIGNVEYPAKSATLHFKVGDKTQDYKISGLEAGTEFWVLLDRDDSDSFSFLGYDADVTECKLSDYKDLDDFTVHLVGETTLKYRTIGTVLVYDDVGSVIECLDLKGIGTKVITSGAKYYRTVR
jgi:hypothetical protein